MKKIILLLVLAMSLPMMAEEKCDKPKHEHHKSRAEWFAQMREKKLVYLVDAMNLTETEKAAFTVLFEKNEAETSECYREMRAAKKFKSDKPTEEEYKNAVKVVRIQTLKIAQLRADYLEELEKIMPAEKIYKLYKAEEAYKKLLISDMSRNKRVEKK